MNSPQCFPRRTSISSSGNGGNADNPYLRRRRANGWFSRFATRIKFLLALTTPIEIVHGTADDTITIEVHANEVVKIVDSVNITEIDGVSHMPHHMNPEVVIEAIDRALSAVQPAECPPTQSELSNLRF